MEPSPRSSQHLGSILPRTAQVVNILAPRVSDTNIIAEAEFRSGGSGFKHRYDSHKPLMTKRFLIKLT